MKKDIFENYVTLVMEQFKISREEFFSRVKSREYAEARHLLYYLCYERKMRISSIKTYMEEGGLKVAHSTIIHRIKHMTIWVMEDPDMEIIAERIKSRITI